MAGGKKRSKKSRPADTTPAPAPLVTPRSGFTEIVPVRFEPSVIAEIRRQAAAQDRSVSWWIRRAVERDLDRHNR